MGPGAAKVIRVRTGWLIVWGPGAHSTGNLLKQGTVISVDEEQRSFDLWLLVAQALSGWVTFIKNYAAPIPGSYKSKGVVYSGSGSTIK